MNRLYEKQIVGSARSVTLLTGPVSVEEDVYVQTMYHIREEIKLRPYELYRELCNYELHKFEIDTDAVGSISNEEMFNKLRDKEELRCSKAVLSTYTG